MKVLGLKRDIHIGREEGELVLVLQKREVEGLIAGGAKAELVFYLAGIIVKKHVVEEKP